ncbi:MAG: hypothetical protein LC687_00995 [Actinobacteria bacterium]|nr:hypothetical protein [Actinomycetota bacterium]
MKNGKLIQRQYPHNPFESTIQQEQTTEDEKEWDAYLREKKEQLGDENYDPIQFQDGTPVARTLNDK